MANEDRVPGPATGGRLIQRVVGWSLILLGGALLAGQIYRLGFYDYYSDFVGGVVGRVMMVCGGEGNCALAIGRAVGFYLPAVFAFFGITMVREAKVDAPPR